MATKIFGTAIPTALLGAYLERNVLPKLVPALFEPSSVAGLSKAVGITLGALAVSGFYLTMYGFKVGAARRKYAELAKKDGEKNAEERYALPNMYVDGGSKHAKAFNCVQRSHQQAFETLPQFYMFTATSALLFPVTAAGIVGMWILGRMVWSSGYAESNGDATKRCTHTPRSSNPRRGVPAPVGRPHRLATARPDDHPLAYFIFASFMAQFFLAMATAGEIAGLWPAVRALAGV